ncbi:hypothetical protein RY26_07670 [Pseudomonas fluorescens]|jgi:hypothetical protein|nr:hypothetical protein RY26_07670 [Pseudomonas fluorescens]
MSKTLEIEFEGKTYRVTYSVDKGLITVRVVFGSKSTQVGNSPPELLAQIMGRELLSEAKGRGQL